MLCGEAANANFVVFCLTRLVLEPTVFTTPRGEHANHYTIDVFQLITHQTITESIYLECTKITFIHGR
jgi:uncharacterized protein (UPF0212 family)